MRRNPWEILVRPVISEKATELGELPQPKYLFRVRVDASKSEVKQAVQEAFKVKVKQVNTVKMKGKPRRVRWRLGRTAQWKKAIVTLEEGQKIEIY